MSKSDVIGVFILTMVINVVLFFILGDFFSSDLPYETAIYSIGTIIVILLSVIITLLVYLVEIMKGKNK
ncbi:hypothetical protein [Bacillus suaedaesalsae]|uniref:Uncharacterized protein n=1 Tax=Bacillus suaedaesalsae TaxID=2810349 RepID=A0ABS2DCV9_9BACI|nr:hypothetical protein [Bacillus suaedaesalsae]MBM6616274.1 hypothetical protein [Bacillus suaedaesalsae]